MKQLLFQNGYPLSNVVNRSKHQKILTVLLPSGNWYLTAPLSPRSGSSAVTRRTKVPREMGKNEYSGDLGKS